MYVNVGLAGIQKVIPLRSERLAVYRRMLFHRVTGYAVVLTMMLFSCLSFGSNESQTILVIADLGSSIHKVFIDALKGEEAINNNLKIIDVADYPDLVAAGSINHNRLLLPVGVNALRMVVRSNPSLPVWAALVPKRSYEALTQYAPSSAQYSAWFIDQPLARRFNLLNLVLPTAERVGVLVGESPDYTVQALKDAAVQESFELIVRRIKDSDAAVVETRKMGEWADVMFAVPDRVSLNLNNAKGILLSAYRQHLPVVGYTKAYVSAGALAAVYSTPQHIAGHLIEELTQFARGSQNKSTLYYPKYYSVAMNTQVARSLGIQVPSQASVLKQLQEQEME